MNSETIIGYLAVSVVVGSSAYAMDDNPKLAKSIAAGLAWPIWLFIMLLAML